MVAVDFAVMFTWPVVQKVQVQSSYAMPNLRLFWDIGLSESGTCLSAKSGLW
jgi:hypothetical protein